MSESSYITEADAIALRREFERSINAAASQPPTDLEREYYDAPPEAVWVGRTAEMPRLVVSRRARYCLIDELDKGDQFRAAGKLFRAVSPPVDGRILAVQVGQRIYDHGCAPLSTGTIEELCTHSEEQMPAAPSLVRALAVEVMQSRAGLSRDGDNHDQRIDIIARPDGWPRSINAEKIGAAVTEIFAKTQVQRLTIGLEGFHVVAYPDDDRDRKDPQTREQAAAAILAAVDRCRG